MLRSLVRSRLSFTLMASMVAAGCGTTMNMQSVDISDHDGRLFVGSTPVDYHREVSLLGEMDDTSLAMVFVSPTASIDVVGSPGNSYELIIDLYTEFEDDGDVELEDGKLSTWSHVDGAMLVNGIRGRLPEGVNLDIRAGTGDVMLTSFISSGLLKVENGTGSVSVKACDVDRISVDSGTGEARLANCTARSVRVKLGIGSLGAIGCVLGDFSGDSGTGDFLFEDSRIDKASFASSVGDVRLTDTLVSSLSNSLGTGQVQVQTTEQSKR